MRSFRGNKTLLDQLDPWIDKLDKAVNQAYKDLKAGGFVESPQRGIEDVKEPTQTANHHCPQTPK